MLRQVGDYDFGGHTGLRAIEVAGLDSGAARAGYQFNFTVRSRVARGDGDEYLFDFHTVVVSAEGAIDERLAEASAKLPMQPFASVDLSFHRRLE